ncbi:MAG: dihydrodipicolinate synthase family protein, partial [Ruthenibacterium sp.]
KHTSTDLFSLERMKSEDNNLLVYNGFDEMLLAGLVMGADGGIGSTYNCMPQVYIALRNAFLAGDYHKAQKLQMLANNMIEAMVKCGVFASVKYILDLQGFNMNGCRKPFASLTEEQKVLLSDVYKGFLQDLVKV